jgi:hypothetical protein
MVSHGSFFFNFRVFFFSWPTTNALWRREFQRFFQRQCCWQISHRYLSHVTWLLWKNCVVVISQKTEHLPMHAACVCCYCWHPDSECSMSHNPCYSCRAVEADVSMLLCLPVLFFFLLYRAWSRQSAASSIYRPWVLDPSFTASPRVCSLALSWRESRCT